LQPTIFQKILEDKEKWQNQTCSGLSLFDYVLFVVLDSSAATGVLKGNYSVDIKAG